MTNVKNPYPDLGLLNSVETVLQNRDRQRALRFLEEVLGPELTAIYGLNWTQVRDIRHNDETRWEIDVAGKTFFVDRNGNVYLYDRQVRNLASIYTVLLEAKDK